jgi:hypothetical protein
MTVTRILGLGYESTGRRQSAGTSTLSTRSTPWRRSWTTRSPESGSEDGQGFRRNAAGTQPHATLGIMELTNGLVTHETQYFADPFPASPGRAAVHGGIRGALGQTNAQPAASGLRATGWPAIYDGSRTAGRRTHRPWGPGSAARSFGSTILRAYSPLPAVHPTAGQAVVEPRSKSGRSNFRAGRATTQKPLAGRWIVCRAQGLLAGIRGNARTNREWRRGGRPAPAWRWRRRSGDPSSRAGTDGACPRRAGNVTSDGSPYTRFQRSL